VEGDGHTEALTLLLFVLNTTQPTYFICLYIVNTAREITGYFREMGGYVREMGGLKREMFGK
jgi:hypothetical protein